MQGGAPIAGLSPVVVPVFVSLLGCGHRCIFCDQRQFSEAVQPEAVPALAERFIAGCSRPKERQRLLAFYGGSFTGIEDDLFERYLAQARMLVERGIVHGVKASTRPDLAEPERVRMCREAGFVEMEIGAQSMDDAVLDASSRGHASGDTVRAASIIKDFGMRLGIQIMPGLPGEDRESYRHTVDRIVGLKPDVARIYPTVVMAGTALERLYLEGAYSPLDLEEAVSRCLYGYVRLSESGCRVLRMGLPGSKGLRITAGPYHESLGFLVKARAFRIMARVLMERFGSTVELSVHPRDVPELLGHKRENVSDLKFFYSFNKDLPRGSVHFKGHRERGCLQPKDIIEYIL